MPLTRGEIEQMVEEEVAPAGLLFADGFDDCIIGLHWRAFDHESCVVYDRDKIIERLMVDNMTYEDAQEYFDFNISGAYVGPHTPIYCSVQLERPSTIATASPVSIRGPLRRRSGRLGAV